jgi:predicted ATPase/DNA-binding CsgD family transcriptional regulator
MTQPGASREPIRFPGVQTATGGTGYGSLPPTNLPTPLTAFIGRGTVVDEICTLIVAENVRILTLTGPGGVGKTRVALKACATLLPEFEDGVFFVSLASVVDPGLVVPAIAGTLGLKEPGGTTVAEALADFLHERSLLLLLDNFEQVASAGPEVTRLLATAPGVRLMLTSRSPLRLYGEYEYSVPPMDLPDEGRALGAHSGTLLLKEIARSEAIQLFVARGKEVSPGLTLTGANALAVAEICRRLDGLPLALELAAARLRIFSPQSLLKRLDKALPLLVGGARDLPTRQQTLRNAIAWSYDLLHDAEQRLFARLGVFAGGCTLDAAAYVASDLRLEQGKLLETIESLIDKNLLRQREQADGEPRFWMLETIREYALEKLAERKEVEQVQEAHAQFFLALGVEIRQYPRGPEHENRLDKLERDHDNFRSALQFLLGRQRLPLAMRMTSALAWFWYVRGYYAEGRRWLNLALCAVKDERDWTTEELSCLADVLRAAGTLAFMQSDHEQAISLTKQGLELARKLGDESNVARTLNNLSIIVSQQGELKQARLFLEESLEIKRRIGGRGDISVALSNLAGNSERMGDYERANSLNEEALAIARETGDKVYLSNRMHTRGIIALREGKPERALAALNESLDLAREVGFRTGELTALSEIGVALCDVAASFGGSGETAGYGIREQESNKAQAILEQTLQSLVEMGDVTGESWVKMGLGRVAELRNEHELAREFMRESLRLNIQLREYSPSTVETVEWLAGVEAEMARRADNETDRMYGAARAATLLGSVEAWRETMGAPVPPIWREQRKQTAALTRTSLGSQAFSAAWSKGRAMPFPEAVALSTKDLHGAEDGTSTGTLMQIAPPPQSSAEGSHDLTAREMDVLRLIAAGLTNKEIGERLVLSHRTVEAHLYSIFNKLNVTTRSAATRYAMEHELARERTQAT